MSEWAARRFWKQATVAPVEGGFTVLLDGRPVRTPAKASLTLPTEGLARTVATEWDAQQEKIDPETMPYTRMANSSVDKVAPQKAEVADMLTAYGDSDLLCYRADAPQELVSRQAAAWDPLLDWAAQTYGARLEPRAGVMHAPQAPEALTRLSEAVHALGHFEMAAFHDLVTLSGSLVIGLAAIQGQASAEVLWAASRIDENWQEEQWGHDEDAAEVAAAKCAAFAHAASFYQLVRTKD